MATNDIKELLARYYDGLTTEEEEARLAQLLDDGDAPGSLKAEQRFFTAMHAVRSTGEKPEGLDRRLEAQIDRWSGEADGTARRSTLRLAMRLRQACGIAASVLAVATLGTYLHGRTSITPDEQAALAQARTALIEFSATLNKGFDQMAAAQEKTAELNRKLSKCMEMTKTDVK